MKRGFMLMDATEGTMNEVNENNGVDIRCFDCTNIWDLCKNERGNIKTDRSRTFYCCCYTIANVLKLMTIDKRVIALKFIATYYNNLKGVKSE